MLLCAHAKMAMAPSCGLQASFSHLQLHLHHAQTSRTNPCLTVLQSSCIRSVIRNRNFSVQEAEPAQRPPTKLQCKAITDFITKKAPTQASLNEEEDNEEEELEEQPSSDEKDKEKEDLPWEGVIVFRRSSLQTNFEYSCTLESLGLFHLSSEASKVRASAAGLGAIPAPALQPHADGTPLHVSIGVSRRNKGDFQLEGLIRTFITQICKRCGQTAVKRVFSNFNLILTDEPVEEFVVEGVIDATLDHDFSLKNTKEMLESDDEEDLLDIYSDDKIYFPNDKKELDISKYIRDIVHLEDTLDAVCDLDCKGICTKCGTNLNINVCQCDKSNQDETMPSPFEIFKEENQES